jgi:beta-galactosidase
LLGVHRALFPRNVPLDYIHIDTISPKQLEQYKLVFFPYPLMLPEAAGAVLKTYVAEGGTLVAEARLGWNNERGLASEIIPGMGLSEVMGVREKSIETAPAGRTTITWRGVGMNAQRVVLPARWFKEVLEPMAAQALTSGRFEDGSPAAVMSFYGKGKTLMLGSYVSAAAQSAPSAAAEAFFAELLDWAQVALPVTVAGSQLEARHLESGADRLLFVFNHGKQHAKANVSLPVPEGNYSGMDLADGRAISLTRGAGRVTLSADLAPAGVQVIRVQRRP